MEELIGEIGPHGYTPAAFCPRCGAILASRAASHRATHRRQDLVRQTAIESSRRMGGADFRVDVVSGSRPVARRQR